MTAYAKIRTSLVVDDLTSLPAIKIRGSNDEIGNVK